MSNVLSDHLQSLTALVRSGRRAEAEQACLSLTQSAQADVALWMFLAALQLDRGAPREAVASMRQAVLLAPKHAGARMQLAVAEFRSGQFDAAKHTLQQLLREQPGHAVAAFHLGLLGEHAQDDPFAIAHYRMALASRADYHEASFRLGLALERAGDSIGALHAFEQAWNAQVPQAEAAVELAQAYLKQQRFELAIEYARIATTLQPAQFRAWLVLGLALRESTQPTLAREALGRARALVPDNPLVLVESGCNQIELGCYNDGIASIVHARKLAPDWQLLRWIDSLALPMLPASREEAVSGHQRFRSGVESLVADLRSDASGMRATAAQGLARATPFYLHYLPMDTTQTTFQYAELVESAVRYVFDESLFRPIDWRALSHQGRIRVGFVSCELRRHTITRYFSGWIAGLDAQRFDVQLWHLGAVADEATDGIRAGASAFHHLPEASVPELAQSIRDAQLDVLVYLDVGMDSRPQMLAALRLAPVQCAAYGHPVSTGLRNVDWFLSGDVMEPTNAQEHYRERLLRLPALGVVPTRPPYAGDASWLPREAGRPLLLCLQSLFKLTPEFDVAIARIAAATDARIIFFEFPASLSARLLDRLRLTFAAHDLDLDRHVEIMGRRNYADYLGGIAAADLVLDSMGFSGGATSLDALHVGTPVVTLEGEFMRGRQTAGMLRLLDMDELIAPSLDDYVDLSIRLCRDHEQRAALRQRLLARAGTLFEAHDVVPALESFFERVANEASTEKSS